MKDNNKRKRSRVFVNVEAVLHWSGGSVPLKATNISLKGMLCEHVVGLEDGTCCKVRMAPSQAWAFDVEAVIIRNSNDGLALDFTGMDENAFSHLRQLVRLHAADPDAIDLELSVPAFVKPSC